MTVPASRPVDFASTRVRLSGRLDSLSPRKSLGGYWLEGQLQLSVPFEGCSKLALRLPMGSALLAGDVAELEGVLVPGDTNDPLLDCCGQ